jgi:uncharacterized membrane protein
MFMKKKFSLLIICCITVVLGLVAMPYLVGAPKGTALPDLVRFIGRFHPLILHLPIGMLTLVLALEGIAFLTKKKANTTLPMFFAAASSVVAVLSGFLLYQGDSDWADSPMVTRHMWGGIIFSCSAVLVFVVKFWADLRGKGIWLYRGGLFASAGIMGYASHDGGSLTHGPDYLTKYAPPAIKKIMGEPVITAVKDEKAAVVDKNVYNDIVAPMMEEKCWKCHNSEKIKGKFRMDTYDLLLKGGKGGAGFVLGDAAKSQIVNRCELPVDDEERMPPDEKPTLTAEQLIIVKWWINSGGKPDQMLVQSNPPADVKAAVEKAVPGMFISTATIPEAKVEATVAGDITAVKLAMTEISKVLPDTVELESQSSTGLIFSAVALRGKFTDEDAAKLAPAISYLTSIDFSSALITDKTLELITSGTSIKMLRLADTKISDVGMDSIAKLTSLESLNLYGTEITDVGLTKLGVLPNLKKLYLWQTKVTPAGIDELKKKIPSCDIILGM